MNGLEQISFEIISAAGMARSLYIESIQSAKKGLFEEAKKKMEEGKELFIQGHHAHAQLIQKEAAGENTTVTLLLVHAEDQLMSTEAFGILASEFLDLYQKMI